jgi:hypothetical protein
MGPRLRKAALTAGPYAALGACSVLLFLLSEPPTLFSDFNKAYYPAGDAILEDGPAAEWQFREEGADGFVNIPIVAYLFAPFALLSEETAGFAFLAAGLAATAAVLLLLSPRGGPTVPLAALFLLNGPLINALREGNSTHFVLLGLTGALLLLAKGRQVPAGALIGVCAIVKLPLLLFGPYFLLRRSWGAALGAGAALATAAGASILIFGLEPHLDWYRACVAPFSLDVVPAFNVQSLDGFLMRLASGASHLREWTPLEPSNAHRIARAVLLCVLFGLPLWELLTQPGHARNPRSDALAFSLVLTLVLIASPLTWSHYYAFLLLPFALTLTGRLDLPDDPLTQGLMRASLVLVSLPVIDVAAIAPRFGETIARTATSAWFFGGLFLFLALLRGLRLQSRKVKP